MDMARIGRSVAVVLGLLAFWTVSPSNVEACEPYTHLQEPDGFHLARGLRWAASAVVVEEIENPEIPDRPDAVILRIRETIVGDGSIGRLRIDQDDGCDGFWYRKGDAVIAAIGRDVGYRPPFDGITNYAVAVWVIKGENVDGRIAVPRIDGRSPTTVAQLRASLAGLPDTATADDPGHPVRDLGGVLWTILAGLVGACFVWRRMSRSDGAPAMSEVVD
jgi:hypothetical protein